jgi:thioesterase DpgC
MQKLAVRTGGTLPAEPAFGASLARDAEAASRYFAEVEAAQQAQKAKSSDEPSAETAALKARARVLKEQFFRRHVAAIYDEVTDHGARYLRASELVAAAAGRYPALLPTRAQIDAERALMQQSAKEGRELDQGLFIAHVLADERCGMHLIHAMLKPKREALERLAEFRDRGLSTSGKRRSSARAKSVTSR